MFALRCGTCSCRLRLRGCVGAGRCPLQLWSVWQALRLSSRRPRRRAVRLLHQPRPSH